jgi:type IV pilus assembly protein PilP
MLKKLIICNVIIGLLVVSPVLLGCGEDNAKSKKASQAVSKKIKKAKAPKAADKQASAVSKTGLAAPATVSAGAKPMIMLSAASYDPAGRVDPFEPLFKEEPAAKTTTSATSASKIKKPRPPLTPLEKVDLSQLELKAVLRTPRGNKALVEESSGKGYIIKKGTYIGTRSGTVVSILKDRVIIEEEFEDALGKVTIQEKELKLQKPLGED